jgi:hypothetical protein
MPSHPILLDLITLILFGEAYKVMKLLNFLKSGSPNNNLKWLLVINVSSKQSQSCSDGTAAMQTMSVIHSCQKDMKVYLYAYV